MSLRTTAILFVLCVLGTWVVDRLERDRGYWFQKDVDQPFSFPLESVQRIRIERPEGPLVLVREDGRMWLDEPLRCPASYARAERVSTVLRELRVRSELDGEPRAYGVGDSGLAVEFQVGNRLHRIEVGERHPQFPYVYATLRMSANSNPRLVLIDASIAEALRNLRLEELRDRTICDVNSFRAGRVVIVDHRSTPPMATELVRDERGWSMTRPAQCDADIGEVRQLVEVLNSWSIDAFVADGVAAGTVPEHGLDPPRWEVTVTSRDASTVAPIWIGADGPADDAGRARVFVAKGKSTSVFLASADVLALLDRAPDVYRDPYLLRLPEPEIRELEVEIPEGIARRAVSLRIVKDEATEWRLTVDGVAEYPVDSSWFSAVTEEVRAAAAAQFVAFGEVERANLQRYGFDRPLRLRVVPEVGTAEQILVGAEVPGRPSERYILNPRWTTYCVTAPMPLADLLREAPWAFRSTRVFEVEADQLTEFALTDSAGPSQVFVRPHRSWFRQGEGETPLPAETLERVVKTITSLNAVAWVPEAEQPPGPESFGIRIEIRAVRDDPGFVPRTFYVSAARGTRERLIRDGDSGWVFLARYETRSVDPFAALVELLRGS
ncbi:MAG: DUF4340 domain-containing protein [Planctomycetota bacterium]